MGRRESSTPSAAQGLRPEADPGRRAKSSVVQTGTPQPRSYPRSARPALGARPVPRSPGRGERQHLDSWTGSGYSDRGLIVKEVRLAKRVTERAAAAEDCVEAAWGSCASVFTGGVGGWGSPGLACDRRCSPRAAAQTPRTKRGGGLQGGEAGQSKPRGHIKGWRWVHRHQNWC